MTTEKITGIVLDGEEWITVLEAAGRGGVTKWAVYQAILHDRIEKRVFMDAIVVPASKVRELWPQDAPEAEAVG